VFKRGKLIDRKISAASKFSSVMDKNRDGGAAVMPCESSPWFAPKPVAQKQ
jgi:hypothetical protein